MSRLVVSRDRCVGSDDFFHRVVGLWESSCDGDMLTDGKAEDRVWGRESKAVAAFVSRLS